MTGNWCRVFEAICSSCCQPVLKTFSRTHLFFNHQQTPEGRDDAPFYICFGECKSTIFTGYTTWQWPSIKGNGLSPGKRGFDSDWDLYGGVNVLGYLLTVSSWRPQLSGGAAELELSSSRPQPSNDRCCDSCSHTRRCPPPCCSGIWPLQPILRGLHWWRPGDGGSDTRYEHTVTDCHWTSECVDGQQQVPHGY